MMNSADHTSLIKLTRNSRIYFSNASLLALTKFNYSRVNKFYLKGDFSNKFYQIVKFCQFQYTSVMLIQQITFRMAQMRVSSTQLSPTQLRNLCQKQEQLILAQLASTRSFDIYAEIAKVCPSQRDLRSLPNEEVSHRLSCLAPIERAVGSPMAMEQPDTEEEAKMDLVEDFLPFDQPDMRSFMDMDEDESMWDSLHME